MYEGEKPVYVTLVSTGVDGLGDPEERTPPFAASS